VRRRLGEEARHLPEVAIQPYTAASAPMAAASREEDATTIASRGERAWAAGLSSSMSAAPVTAEFGGTLPS
jgi:hypothetical protein